MSGPGVAGSDGDGDGDGDADARHAHRTPTYSAAFVSSLQPVADATRSISETEWPMLVTYLKELGFNPEEVSPLATTTLSWVVTRSLSLLQILTKRSSKCRI
jgi:hypothetical protein